MSIILHYFDIYARGEVIRALLHCGELPFEDRRYIFTEWPSHQSNFEFGELPCLEIDGLRLVQSRSIARYLCQKLGYYNSDPYLNYLSSSLVDAKEDFVQKKIQMVWFEKNHEGWLNWLRTDFSYVLKAFEKRYVENGETGYFVRDSATIGDFEIFFMLHDQFIRESVKEVMLPILTSAAPKLIDFVERFKTLNPHLVTYLEKREHRPF